MFTSFISVHWITPWARRGGTSGEFHIHPPAQTRVRQSRLVSPRMENPKSLWTTCSRFGCPHSEKGVFLALNGLSCISDCSDYLLSFHYIPLRRIWLHLPSYPCQVFTHSCNVHNCYQQGINWKEKKKYLEFQLL